jgi:hypothetical protein
VATATGGQARPERQEWEPVRRFIVLTLVFLVAFIAASPLYLDSRLLLSVAALAARSAALILRLTGLDAVATANMLTTSRGSFLVTQECLSTPLIPVYLAAVAAYSRTWRRGALALLAAAPLFFVLGVARLLVVALPNALVGSPRFAIHAFYQVLLAVVVVHLAAAWLHGPASLPCSDLSSAFGRASRRTPDRPPLALLATRSSRAGSLDDREAIAPFPRSSSASTWRSGWPHSPTRRKRQRSASRSGSAGRDPAVCASSAAGIATRRDPGVGVVAPLSSGPGESRPWPRKPRCPAADGILHGCPVRLRREVAAISALALIITLVVAAPVLLAPSERIFGRELVGRNHDPFTVIAQFSRPFSLGIYSQPVTDLSGAMLAKVLGPVPAYTWLILLSFPLAAPPRVPPRPPHRASPAGATMPPSPSPSPPSTSPTPPITRTSLRSSGFPSTSWRSGVASIAPPRGPWPFSPPRQPPSPSRTSTAV